MPRDINDLSMQEIAQIDRDLIISGARNDQTYQNFKRANPSIADARVTNTVAAVSINLNTSFDDIANPTPIGRDGVMRAHRGDVVEAEAIAIAKAAWESYNEGNRRVNANAIVATFLDAQNIESTNADRQAIVAAGRNLASRDGNSL